MQVDQKIYKTIHMSQSVTFCNRLHPAVLQYKNLLMLEQREKLFLPTIETLAQILLLIQIRAQPGILLFETV